MPSSHEFDPTPASWPIRAYYTPVTDALRGRLSGRLDIRPVIAAAGLPAPLAGLVYQVARRSRLWHGEKVDVARELCAHFDDGLTAGQSVDQLIADFGSPDLAARLIRQAKLRNRPLWWQAFYYASRAFLLSLAVGLLFYAALAVRFYFSRPTITHNYWHEINAARQVPEDERAWPLYREAAIKLGARGKSQCIYWPDQQPQGKHWDQVVAALDAHHESLELARRGAQKSKLGLYVGDPEDRQAAEAGAAWFGHGTSTANENGEMYSLPLGEVSAIDGLARLLNADAQRAAIAADGATALADLTAIISISEQLQQPRASLVEQMVSLHLLEIAMQSAFAVLAKSPEIFDDDQLVALTHRLAAYRQGDTLDLSGERIRFADVLQRTFTDDGQGNGRITPEGIKFFKDVFHDSLPTKVINSHRAALYTIGAGTSALVADRAENQRLYDSLLEKLQATYQGAPWEWEREGFRGSQVELFDNAFSSPRQVLRYLPVALLFPGLYHSVYDVPQRAMMQRDALQVTIALILWQRRHGEWPEKLDQLVPRLLPAVPPDRFDGRLLRYLLRDDRPVLYSVGVDRLDDGGKPPEHSDLALMSRFGKMDLESLKLLREGWMNVGDWILWPPLPAKDADEESVEN